MWSLEVQDLRTFTTLIGLCVWILCIVFGKLKQQYQKLRIKSKQKVSTNNYDGGRLFENSDNDDEFFDNHRRSYFATESYRMMRRNKLDILSES